MAKGWDISHCMLIFVMHEALGIDVPNFGLMIDSDDISLYIAARSRPETVSASITCTGQLRI
jgi:hypothetical protein